MCVSMYVCVCVHIHTHFESMTKGYEIIKNDPSEFKQPNKTSSKYNNKNESCSLWPHRTREPEQWPQAALEPSLWPHLVAKHSQSQAGNPANDPAQMQNVACGPRLGSPDNNSTDRRAQLPAPHSCKVHWWPRLTREPGQSPLPTVEHSQQPAKLWSITWGPVWSWVPAWAWSPARENIWPGSTVWAPPDQVQSWNPACSPVQSWSPASSTIVPGDTACNPTQPEVISEPSQWLQRTTQLTQSPARTGSAASGPHYHGAWKAALPN